MIEEDLGDSYEYEKKEYYFNLTVDRQILTESSTAYSKAIIYPSKLSLILHHYQELDSTSITIIESKKNATPTFNSNSPRLRITEVIDTLSEKNIYFLKLNFLLEDTLNYTLKVIDRGSSYWVSSATSYLIYDELLTDSIRIIPGMWHTHFQKNDNKGIPRQYVIDEYFPVGNEYYRLTDLNPFNLTISLERLSENEIPVGYKKGYKIDHSLFQELLKKYKLTHESVPNTQARIYHFWGTWCGPCISKVDQLEDFATRVFHEKGIPVLGIPLLAKTETPESFEQTCDTLKVKHPQLIPQEKNNSANPLVDYFKVITYPTYIYVGETGLIEYRGGSLKKLQEYLEMI